MLKILIIYHVNFLMSEPNELYELFELVDPSITWLKILIIYHVNKHIGTEDLEII